MIELDLVKAKEEGWLPWEKWWDNVEFRDYHAEVRNYFKPFQKAYISAVENYKNVTYMTMEKYNYYVMNQIQGWKGSDRSHLICFGSIHNNITYWYVAKMNDAYNNYTMNETANTKNKTISFSWIDPRTDEALSLAFRMRYQYQIFFIDQDDGMVYVYDNKTHVIMDGKWFYDWIMTEAYKNTSIKFPAPKVPNPDEFWKYYVVKWIRENFGGRFCRLVHRVPFIEKYCFFMICDWDKTDYLNEKEDRFTIVAFPLFVLFVALPWLWWTVKQIWSALIWCCTWNVYVYEDELKDE